MILGPANATLLAVVGPGHRADYDRPATAGDTLWAPGAEPERCYLFDGLETTDGSSRASGSAARTTDIVEQRRMLVDPALDVDWEPGLTVTARRFDAETDTTGVVDDVKRITFPGVPGLVRLVLSPA